MKSPAFLLFCLLPAAVLLLPGGCRTSFAVSAEAETFYEEGSRAAASGHRQGAIAAYRKALEVSPGMTAARFNLALALGESGSYPEALAELEELQSLAPDNLRILHALGWLHQSYDKPAEALEIFTRILEIFEADSEALAETARVLESLDRRDEALESRRELLRLRPDSANRLALADALLAAGRHQEALDSYRDVLAEMPSGSGALTGAADAAERLGLIQDSLAYRRRLVENRGEGAADATWDLARTLLNLRRDYAGGLETLKQAVEFGFDQPDAILELLPELPPELRPAIETLAANLQTRLDEAAAEAVPGELAAENPENPQLPPPPEPSESPQLKKAPAAP